MRVTESLKARARRTRLYNLWQRRWEDKQLVAWARSPHLGPPPTLFKQRVVREHARRFSLSALVETGTFHGEMIQGVIDDFRTIYSIELDPALSARAVSKFRGVPNVIILNGDSGDLLGDVVRRLDGPAIFWLDGHFSGEGTARGVEATPVLRELEHILTASHPDGVILVDDARCFGQGGWPSIEDLRRRVLRTLPLAVFTVAEDIIRITPAPRRR